MRFVSRLYEGEICGEILSEAEITANLRNFDVFHVETRKSVTSTNTILRELAAQGAPEGYVLAADEQTAGKGRLGRHFYSPAGHGVYFSVLLRPGSKTKEPGLITTAAAVAAARALEDVFGVKAGIKWVNDLFVDGKKICGILTEASFDSESGFIKSAVLGIGINITKPDEGYPEWAGGAAAALTDMRSGVDGGRCRLIAAALDDFWEFYQNLSERGFMEEYKTRSIVLGKDIFVLTHEGKKRAHALAIDDGCELVVRYTDGRIEKLGAGEVSIIP